MDTESKNFIEELNNEIKSKDEEVDEKFFEDQFMSSFKDPILKLELDHIDITKNNKYKIIDEKTINDLCENNDLCDFTTTKLQNAATGACAELGKITRLHNSTSIINVFFKYFFEKIKMLYNLNYEGTTYVYTKTDNNLYVPTKNKIINSNNINYTDKCICLFFDVSFANYNKKYEIIHNMIIHSVSNMHINTDFVIRLKFNPEKSLYLINKLQQLYSKIIIFYANFILSTGPTIYILCINKINTEYIKSINLYNSDVQNIFKFSNIIANKLTYNYNFIQKFYLKLNTIQKKSVLYKTISYYNLR
jgi:hypothetical protein